MATSRRKLVVRLYEAWNRGERDELTRYYTEDVVFDWSRRKLDPAVVSGEDDILEVQRQLAAPWSEHRMELEDAIEHGPSVVVFVHVTGRGAASGLKIDARVAHVWTFRHDGLVERTDYFGDRGEALAAVGTGA